MKAMIGDIAKVRVGYGENRFEEGDDLMVIRFSSIQNYYVNTDDIGKMKPIKSIATLNKQLLRLNDVLLCSRTKTRFKTAIIDTRLDNISVPIAPILVLSIVNPQVNPFYIAWYLQTSFFVCKYEKYRNTQGIIVLTKSLLVKHKISIPSLEEQNKLESYIKKRIYEEQYLKQQKQIEDQQLEEYYIK
jgi:restriction endonuclease S subunit